jgi:hypothetical protein
VNLPSTTWLKGISARSSFRRRIALRDDVIDGATISDQPREPLESRTSTPWAQSAVRNSYQEAADALVIRQSPQTHVDVTKYW